MPDTPSSCNEDRKVTQLGRMFPEELSVEVALEFELELALESKFSFGQSSDSSPDSNVLSEFLNRLRLEFNCKLMLGNLRLTLLLTGVVLEIIVLFDACLEVNVSDEHILELAIIKLTVCTS